MHESKLSPLSKWGHHMTVEKFVEGVESALFTDSDGVGDYATATMQYEEKMFSPSEFNMAFAKKHGFTHVMWYNK